MIANDNYTAAYRELACQMRLRRQMSACGIFEATKLALALPEEECGLEIYTAMSTMIREGLVGCSTIEADGSIIFGSETVLSLLRQTLQ